MEDKGRTEEHRFPWGTDNAFVLLRIVECLREDSRWNVTREMPESLDGSFEEVWRVRGHRRESERARGRSFGRKSRGIFRGILTTLLAILSYWAQKESDRKRERESEWNRKMREKARLQCSKREREIDGYERERKKRERKIYITRDRERWRMTYISRAALSSLAWSPIPSVNKPFHSGLPGIRSYVVVKASKYTDTASYVPFVKFYEFAVCSVLLAQSSESTQHVLFAPWIYSSENNSPTSDHQSAKNRSKLYDLASNTH